MTLFLNPALAFIAGLLTILSPCTLPLVPIVIAGARARDARGPLALAAGLALTFGVVGGAFAAFGIEVGSSDGPRIAAAALMVLIGGFLLVPSFAHALERALAPLAAWAGGRSSGGPAFGLAGQAGVGALLAVGWAPCAGPTLGAAMALAATGHSLPFAILTMSFYAAGAATALLAAGYGLKHLALNSRRRLASAAMIGRMMFGVTFVLTGIAIMTGFDHVLEAAFITHMPGWLVGFATRL